MLKKIVSMFFAATLLTSSLAAGTVAASDETKKPGIDEPITCGITVKMNLEFFEKTHVNLMSIQIFVYVELRN